MQPAVPLTGASLMPIYFHKLRCVGGPLNGHYKRAIVAGAVNKMRLWVGRTMTTGAVFCMDDVQHVRTMHHDEVLIGAYFVARGDDGDYYDWIPLELPRR